MNNFLFAFLMTLFAGLSTGIGSALAFFTKKTNRKALSISLGFSAGVMIYVSLVELYGESSEILITVFGNPNGKWVALISFFSGVFVIALIDKLIPKIENPHELKMAESMELTSNVQKNLIRLSFFTALAIVLHNIPEGLAAFISALQRPSIAFPIVLAIAIHNIPEGIAVSIPLYFATGSKRKAFLLSFLSGLSEPLGALLFYIIFRPLIGDIMLGIMISFVSGIMIFISLDGLLPAARKYGEHHLSIYGMIGGMLIMAISLNLLG